MYVIRICITLFAVFCSVYTYYHTASCIAIYGYVNACMFWSSLCAFLSYEVCSAEISHSFYGQERSHDHSLLNEE